MDHQGAVRPAPPALARQGPCGARPGCSRELRSTTPARRLTRLASAGMTQSGRPPAYRSASTVASPSSVAEHGAELPALIPRVRRRRRRRRGSGSLRRARNARLRSRSSASAGSAGSSDSRVDRTNSRERRVGEPVIDPCCSRVRDSSPASQSTFKCRDTRGWLCPRTAAMSDTDSSRLPATPGFATAWVRPRIANVHELL